MIQITSKHSYATKVVPKPVPSVSHTNVTTQQSAVWKIDTAAVAKALPINFNRLAAFLDKDQAC